MILLDTHIWVWWVQNIERLSEVHRKIISENESSGLGISIILCRKAAKLVEYKSARLEEILHLIDLVSIFRLTLWTAWNQNKNNVTSVEGYCCSRMLQISKCGKETCLVWLNGYLRWFVINAESNTLTPGCWKISITYLHRKNLL